MNEINPENPPETISKDKQTTTVIWIVLGFFFFLVGWCVFHSRRRSKNTRPDRPHGHGLRIFSRHPPDSEVSLSSPEAAHVRLEPVSVDTLPEYEVPPGYKSKSRVDQSAV